MGSYIVRVVSSTDPEVSADDRVTEAVLSDIDRLFSEICRGIVRAELRLQGDVPESLYAHLGIGSQGALAHDARRFLDETLDYLGGTTRGTWMDDSYPDVPGRKRIAGIVLDIFHDLEGCTLLHGYGEDLHQFSDIDTVWVTGMAGAVTRAHGGGLMGVIVKDPERKGHWAISNGASLVPVSYTSGISRYEQEDFAAAGPVIAIGTVIRDEMDRIVELRAVENCYTFPGAVFLRGISAGRDIGLVYPLEGVPSYYARASTWHLRCDDLGLESSADTWDGCVIGFHRKFVDLWHSHRDGTAPDNPKVRGLLDRMCPLDGGPDPTPSE